MYASVYDDYEFLQPALTAVDPDAKLGLVPVFNGVTNAQVGSALYIIPKTVSPEEKRDAIFRYFDSSLNQDILTGSILVRKAATIHWKTASRVCG